MSGEYPLYDNLLNVCKTRMSVRNLKPDPLPPGHVEKIVEAGRWAMSGANSQPWEFIIVTQPDIKQELWDAYVSINCEYTFWMEQMRLPELRHPSFHMPGSAEEQLARYKSFTGWSQVPALIVVLGDGRKQWGTVMGGHTFGRGMSHLTDGLANACQIMHLAAAALGLGTQWVTIHVQEPFKRILGIPDLIMLHTIIPVGYPNVERREGIRRNLSELVHYETYDRDKYLSDKQIVEYLTALRKKTVPKYRASRQVQKEDQEGGN